MGVEVWTFEADVAPNAIEQTLESNEQGKTLYVRKGEKIVILEMGFRISNEGRIDVYLDNKKIAEMTYSALLGDNRRILFNSEISEGSQLVFKGTDRSGATNKMSVYVVIDRLKA